jgi:hypothetical protein
MDTAEFAQYVKENYEERPNSRMNKSGKELIESDNF